MAIFFIIIFSILSILELASPFQDHFWNKHPIRQFEEIRYVSFCPPSPPKKTPFYLYCITFIV